jgi:hypothetical protein
VSCYAIGFLKKGDATDNRFCVTFIVVHSGLVSVDIVDDQTMNAGEIM